MKAKVYTLDIKFKRKRVYYFHKHMFYFKFIQKLVLMYALMICSFQIDTYRYSKSIY